MDTVPVAREQESGPSTPPAWHRPAAPGDSASPRAQRGCWWGRAGCRQGRLQAPQGDTRGTAAAAGPGGGGRELGRSSVPPFPPTCGPKDLPLGHKLPLQRHTSQHLLRARGCAGAGTRAARTSSPGCSGQLGGQHAAAGATLLRTHHGSASRLRWELVGAGGSPACGRAVRAAERQAERAPPAGPSARPTATPRPPALERGPRHQSQAYHTRAPGPRLAPRNSAGLRKAHCPWYLGTRWGRQGGSEVRRPIVQQQPNMGPRQQLRQPNAPAPGSLGLGGHILTGHHSCPGVHVAVPWPPPSPTLGWHTPRPRGLPCSSNATRRPLPPVSPMGTGTVAGPLA